MGTYYAVQSQYANSLIFKTPLYLKQEIGSDFSKKHLFK